jgi:FAD/FMN-containing dehydrogenase
MSIPALTQPVSGAPVAELLRSFGGPIHVPGDETYDAQRAALNPAFDSRPAIVAEATSPTDIRAALAAARNHDLPFAVQATGHGTFVPSDRGVLVKTGRMAQVLVDPDRRIARVGPGARWSDVIAASAPFGLAPLSGSSPSVGVAGYTLGGGVGWLARAYGFAADSLLRVDIVTADGRHLTASRGVHADLFWALRGGSGNFGVVTAMEFRLHPVAEAYGGVAYFPIDRAADTLAYYRDWAPTQPNELSTTVVLMQNAPRPEIEGPVLAIRGFYVGSSEDGARALRPLQRVAGQAMVDEFRPMTYPDAATIGGTAPRQLELYDDLPGGLVDTVVDAVGGGRPTISAVEVRHWGGAMADAGPDAGPVGHRDTPFSFTIDGSPAAAAPLAPYATGGSFLNWLHDTSRTADAYTPSDYARLREIKRAYDPDNVFHRHHNIRPA